ASRLRPAVRRRPAMKGVTSDYDSSLRRGALGSHRRPPGLGRPGPERIGLRGNLDEGEPYGLPGTYLNSLYEERPLPYAEAGYGFPQVGQTVINVTNGKVIRLLVNDEPFDIRYGTVHSHVRTLDLRAGTLTRNVDWTSPAGNRVRITSVRLVSLTQRAVAAVRYTVTPVG